MLPKYLSMNRTIFSVDFGSDEQPHNVFVAMRNVLTLVLEESEKIPSAMVEVILKNLLKQKKVDFLEFFIIQVSFLSSFDCIQAT